MTRADFDPIELLYLALGSERGVVVKTNNAPLAKQRLSQAKATSPDFESIAVSTSRIDPATEVWLVKKEKRLGQEDEPEEAHPPPSGG